jgi:hypothetical protein
MNERDQRAAAPNAERDKQLREYEAFVRMQRHLLHTCIAAARELQRARKALYGQALPNASRLTVADMRDANNKYGIPDLWRRVREADQEVRHYE